MEVKSELLQGDIERFFQAEADIRAGLLDMTPTDLTAELLNFTKAMKGVDKERFGLLLSEFTSTLKAQRRISGNLHPARNNGVIVRAACRSGIVTGLDESGVDNLKPWQVTQYAADIGDAIAETFNVPKA